MLIVKIKAKAERKGDLLSQRAIYPILVYETICFIGLSVEFISWMLVRKN